MAAAFAALWMAMTDGLSNPIDPITHHHRAARHIRLADGTRLDLVEAAHRPDGAVWLDLVSPDDDSLALAEDWTGIRLPGPGSMHLVAPSHRFRRKAGGLTLVLPLVLHDRQNQARVEPVGAMLSRDLVVTVRRHEGAAFAHLNEMLDDAAEGGRPLEPDQILVALVEALVGAVADGLALVAADLAPLSRRAFATPVRLGRGGRFIEVQLQAVMRTLGRLADNLGIYLEALGWLDAVPEFLNELSGHAFAPAEAARIAVLDRDIDALIRQANNTVTRVQMLLDATLGAINIRQAAVVKVLSVVATIFLPPTLIASLYGMNFEWMPELHAPWGYPASLALMAATAILPYVVMKWRGWL